MTLGMVVFPEALLPVNATVEVLAVNVPEFTNGAPVVPERVIVRLDASSVPAVMVSMLDTFSAAPRVRVFLLPLKVTV